MSAVAKARCPIDRDGGAVWLQKYQYCIQVGEKKRVPKTSSSSPQLYVISISGAPGLVAMNTSVNFPFSESFRLVSFSPSAWKNDIDFSKLEERSMQWRKINSSSDGDMEWYVSGAK